MIAYWLLPDESASRYFSVLIHELAAKFDAPIFDPHVTIYAGGEESIAGGAVNEVSNNRHR